MGLYADDKLNTEEHGYIEASRLYQYSLPGSPLCYHLEYQGVVFYPLLRVELEARKEFYVISTLKRNRVTITRDTLVYSAGEWFTPDKLIPGMELWMNHGKSIVTDAVMEVKHHRKSIRAYVPRIQGNLPYFGNNILLREQEIQEEDDFI